MRIVNKFIHHEAHEGHEGRMYVNILFSLRVLRGERSMPARLDLEKISSFMDGYYLHLMRFGALADLHSNLLRKNFLFFG